MLKSSSIEPEMITIVDMLRQILWTRYLFEAEGYGTWSQKKLYEDWLDLQLTFGIVAYIILKLWFILFNILFPLFGLFISNLIFERATFFFMQSCWTSDIRTFFRFYFLTHLLVCRETSFRADFRNICNFNIRRKVFELFVITFLCFFIFLHSLLLLVFF